MYEGPKTGLNNFRNIRKLVNNELYAQGAQTIIYCATDKQLENETGNFYRDCRRFNSTHTFDDDIAEKLWRASENLIECKTKKE